MGRLRVRSGALAQWARGGLIVSLVIVMAAASSGALGATAWATVSVPSAPLYQADNSPDNNGGPVVPGQTVLIARVCPGTTSIFVGSLTDFAIGNTVRINPGGATQEDARVVDVGCDDRSLHLAGPLQFRHQRGELVVIVSQAAGASTTTTTTNNKPGNDDRERTQSQRRTEEQRRQSEQTNRSGRDDIHTEGDVSAVDLSSQPPEIIILTRDGPQIVQLQCGDQCPTVRVGDYVEVDGAKQNEGLFYADTVTISKR
jgi:hypothetical protein